VEAYGVDAEVHLDDFMAADTRRWTRISFVGAQMWRADHEITSAHQVAGIRPGQFEGGLGR